jgi:hypothetical protein
MELVIIDEWQQDLEALTTEPYAEVTRQKTLVRPDERYKMIFSVADGRQLNNDWYLEKFCLTVIS